MLTDQQVKRLEEAFYNECSEEEAARYAGITMTDLDWFAAQHTDDGLFLKMKQSFHARNAQAAINVGKSVDNGSIEDSWKLLERRKSKMYSPKAELNLTNERPMIIMPALPQPDTKDITDFQRIIDVDAAPTRQQDV